ncbi:hypothetical protein EV715DRAFT_190743 [Schizophyllum commune]
MGFFSTVRRTLRRAAQRLGRRQPHEVRVPLAALGPIALTDTMLQLDLHSFVGGDKSAYPSLGWPYLERYSLESPHAVSDDSVDAPVKVPLPSDNSINGLPTELLSLIFLESAYEPYERPHLGPHFVPFILTHVCKLWRDIAVEMPPLWQQFELRPCVEKGSHRELAKICAERARGLGLVVAYHELSVDEYDGSWFNDHTGLPRDIDFCDCPMDFIIEYIDLIKDLDVSIGEKSILRLADGVESPVSMLERLSMTFYCDLPDPEVLVNLYSGPKLMDLSWSANECGRDAPHMVECPDAPWRQLVELELLDCPLTLDTFMDVLEDAPLLQRVFTQVDCQSPVTIQNQGPIRHDALRDLTVKGDGPLDVVFSACSFPALRKLALWGIKSPYDPDPPGWPFWQPDLLLQVVRQAERGLERLHLDACGTISESMLIDCLRLPQMSTVLKLTISTTEPVITQRLISLFDPATSDPVLLPSLEKLILEGCATEDGVIAEMLLARRAKTDKLRYVLVDYDSGTWAYPRLRDEEVIEEFFEPY